VLIVGDLMLDEYLWGDVERISPEAPVPVMELRRRFRHPGGAANVAANVVSLGGFACLFGVIGNDLSGKQLIEDLEALGINAKGVVAVDDRPTTSKMRIVAHSQQIVRIDSEDKRNIAQESERQLLRHIAELLPTIDVLVISDYGKGVVTQNLASGAIEMARGAGIHVLVDPKGTDYSRYSGASLVTPNMHEAERAANLPMRDDSDLQEIGNTLLGILGGSFVLITRGSAGMTLFKPDGTFNHIPSIARQVFDVTGAGDTVIAVMALALASSMSLDDGMAIANKAAGIKVGKSGTAAITADELMQ
jgi:D-beta-D-heptose 7-phosphate kinase/D-beta-D-heptose 1-phosphate adenosyltransferase